MPTRRCTTTPRAPPWAPWRWSLFWAPAAWCTPRATPRWYKRPTWHTPWTHPLPPRLLVRTRVHPAPAHWDADFRALAPALLQHLADRGLLLVGVDTPSVDPSDSTDLPSHQVLRQRDLRVLENLVLDEVPEGDYELIALPLKLSTADASPVRAVLRAL
jgi:kynurenine formamidase